MNSSVFQILQINEVQLKELIEKIIEEKPDKPVLPPKEEVEYLTRVEASKFLKVGLTKLNELTRMGKINYIKEGTTVFYIKSHLIEYRNSLIIKAKAI